jgi:hypothetical protein
MGLYTPEDTLHSRRSENPSITQISVRLFMCDLLNDGI